MVLKRQFFKKDILEENTLVLKRQGIQEETLVILGYIWF